MKVDNSKLNPIYEQYSNEENRLTHAILHTIGSSNWIFTSFLNKVVGIKPFRKSGIFEISTQKVPLGHGDSDSDKVESIPDAWIINESPNLGIAIEVKDRKNNIRISQLKSHTNRISGYDHAYLLVITPDLQTPDKIIRLQKKNFTNLQIKWKSWDEIYGWLKHLLNKPSKTSKDKFLLTSMIEYLERRREVLGFQGIKFSKGFNVDEAKEILKSEMEELHPYVKGIYKELVARRGGIPTTSVMGVWDSFGDAEGFTNDIHITIGINEDAHNILLVVPNSSKKSWNRLKEIFSNEKYRGELMSILARYRKNVPHLYIEFVQRHFINRRIGIHDGHLFFDLEVMGKPFMKKNSKTKQSSIWFQALYEAIINKRNLNGQVAFYTKFFLNETKGIDKPEFINTMKSTLKNLKPLYDYLKAD